MTTERKARELLARAVPHLHDAAEPYEDDGSNEPLELAREIEDFMAAPASVESPLSSASLGFDGAGVAALESAGQGEDDAWKPSNSDYDRAIHSNPDASAWADLFVATFPGLADKHDLMLGWFANAMMAMHDHVSAKPVTVTPEVLMAVASFFHDGPVRDWRVVRSIEAYLASGRAAPQQPEAQAGGAVVDDPTTDREMLLYLMQQFDGEVHVCPCGREDPTSRCDSAIALRGYLAANPAHQQQKTGVVGEVSNIVAWHKPGDSYPVLSISQLHNSAMLKGGFRPLIYGDTTPPAKVPEGMLEIGELIRSQDNRITEAPIFIVQQKAGRNRWEFVTACFTEQGCKDYIAKDGHNLREPRIFASGSYRNDEWRAVRGYLASLAAAPAPKEGV